jgi:hypothetical protein
MSKQPVKTPKVEKPAQALVEPAAAAMTPFDDGWNAVPRRDGMIRGSLIKFTNGEFACNGQVINDAQFVPTDVVTYWMRWADGQPAETLVTRAGERHPEREELGHDDEAEWEAGLDGRPSDPWRDSRNVYLVDPRTAQEFTFTTSSWGGRDAVEELARSIAFVRNAGHPGALPLIRLDVGRMKTRFGPKPKPLFKVVDWRYDAKAEMLLKQHTPPKQIEAQAEKPLSKELNDEIPF